MRRRAVLAGLAVSLPAALAGCTGGSPPEGSPGTDATERPSGTDTPTDETPADTVAPGRISATLRRRETCPNPGEATVEFDDGSASVAGCVVGNNGCNVPRLRDTSYDANAAELTVVVAAVDESGPETNCTHELVHLGYEVAVAIDTTTVTSVVVVHDTWEGRRTVVDVTR